MVRQMAPTYVHFHCAHGFSTRTLARMLDSLVRVSRRAACGHYASIRADAQSSTQAGRIAPRAITLPGEPRSRGLCPAARVDAGPPAEE
jgi:hypothetical protein